MPLPLSRIHLITRDINMYVLLSSNYVSLFLFFWFMVLFFSKSNKINNSSILHMIQIELTRRSNYANTNHSSHHEYIAIQLLYQTFVNRTFFICTFHVQRMHLTNSSDKSIFFRINSFFFHFKTSTIFGLNIWINCYKVKCICVFLLQYNKE